MIEAPLKIKYMGFGSPLMDRIGKVDDEFIQTYNTN